MSAVAESAGEERAAGESTVVRSVSGEGAGAESLAGERAAGQGTAGQGTAGQGTAGQGTAASAGKQTSGGDSSSIKGSTRNNSAGNSFDRKSSAVRWLVTGARGQLGSELAEVLRNENVTLAGRAELDVTRDDVGDRLRAWAAEAGSERLVVLNAAAWTDVDGAESDPTGAAAVNADGPARLASACAELGAELVHVSTDYVFPSTGRTEPYDVDDPVGPTGVYGATKEAGERAVRAALPAHYIVRTAWVYGAVGRNFVKTIARLRHERETLDVVDDQVGCPTWAADLARGLVELVRSGAPYGTYHCAGSGRASWYELARAVFEELGADPARIRPCDSSRFPRPAPRPAYSVLSGRSWAAAGLRPMPPWRESLRSAFAVSRSSFDTPA